MRRVAALVVSAGALVGLTGCWPVPGQGPDRQAHNAFETGFDAESVAGFTRLWVATTDEAGPRGVGHPVLSTGGGVHVTSGRSVHALDPATGAQRWASTPATSAPTFAELDTDVLVHEDQLFTGVRVSGASWQLAVCHAATGGCDTANGEVPGRPEAIRSSSASDRTLLLSRFAARPGGGTAQYAYPFGHGPEVLLTEQSNGSRLTLGTSQVFHAGVGVGTAPGNGVRAFPVAGGAGWTRSIDGSEATTPVLSSDGSTVYAGTDAGTLYALSSTDGHVLWTAQVSEGIGATPALAEGTLYVPNRTGTLFAFPASGCGAPTCTPSWSTVEGSAVVVQPAVAAGVVFTGSADGTVAAYDAAGCGRARCGALWSASTGSRITGAPAVSGGRLFVGTQDGRLVAYGLPPT